MPVRLWSSIAEWSSASLGSVTFIPQLSAMTTCSRASSSQRHSSKPSATSPHPLLTYMEHDKIHIVWIQYIPDTQSNLGPNVEAPSWSTNCSFCTNTWIRYPSEVIAVLTVLPLTSSVKHSEEMCAVPEEGFIPYLWVSVTHNFNYWTKLPKQHLLPFDIKVYFDIEVLF